MNDKNTNTTDKNTNTTDKNTNTTDDCGPDTHGALAQSVAQSVVSRKDAGSSPARLAKITETILTEHEETLARLAAM